jgi:hypothetical protein
MAINGFIVGYATDEPLKVDRFDNQSSTLSEVFRLRAPMWVFIYQSVKITRYLTQFVRQDGNYHTKFNRTRALNNVLAAPLMNICIFCICGQIDLLFLVVVAMFGVLAAILSYLYEDTLDKFLNGRSTYLPLESLVDPGTGFVSVPMPPSLSKLRTTAAEMASSSKVVESLKEPPPPPPPSSKKEHKDDETKVAEDGDLELGEEESIDSLVVHSAVAVPSATRKSDLMPLNHDSPIAKSERFYNGMALGVLGIQVTIFLVEILLWFMLTAHTRSGIGILVGVALVGLANILEVAALQSNDYIGPLRRPRLDFHFNCADLIRIVILICIAPLASGAWPVPN